MKSALPPLLTMLALVAAPLARADYFIVVSTDSPVRELAQKDVLHLYMGRTRQVPGGGAAIAYDMADSTHREGFYRALSGLSLPQVTSYWARLMFSGRNLPPQRLDDEAQMIERVLRDPAAIGWLPAPPKQKDLRTVLVLKEAP